jgi:hypothetical protein
MGSFNTAYNQNYEPLNITTMSNTNGAIYYQSPTTYIIAGHYWSYDIASMWYTSVDRPHIKLNADMVAAIQAGQAVIDWDTERLRYVDRADAEYSLHEVDTRGAFPLKNLAKEDRKERDWLDAQINAVRRLAVMT